MLKRKRNARNKVERYKKRLVALGNLQRKSEIGDIYSLVIKYATIKTVLSVAVARNLKIR